MMDKRPKDGGFFRRTVAVIVLTALILLVFLLRLAKFQLGNDTEYVSGITKGGTAAATAYE